MFLVFKIIYSRQADIYSNTIYNCKETLPGKYRVLNALQFSTYFIV